MLELITLAELWDEMPFLVAGVAAFWYIRKRLEQNEEDHGQLSKVVAEQGTRMVRVEERVNGIGKTLDRVANKVLGN